MSVSNPRRWLAARIRAAAKAVHPGCTTPGMRMSAFIAGIMWESELSAEEKDRIFESLNSYYREKTE